MAFLHVGDVFVAPSLELATFADDDGTGRKVLIVTSKDSQYRVKGKPGRDPSRRAAEFVVERTETSGGSTNRHDPWTDGWGVHARRLSPDGSYDPDGESVFFRQEGNFVNLLTDAHKTRTLKLNFT